jgi:hypothetical protein
MINSEDISENILLPSSNLPKKGTFVRKRIIASIIIS